MLQIYDAIEYYIQGYVPSDWLWWDFPPEKQVDVDAD